MNGSAKWVGLALAFLGQFAMIVWHSSRMVKAIENLESAVAAQLVWQQGAQKRLEADALNIAVLQFRMNAHEKAVP